MPSLLPEAAIRAYPNPQGTRNSGSNRFSVLGMGNTIGALGDAGPYAGGATRQGLLPGASWYDPPGATAWAGTSSTVASPSPSSARKAMNAARWGRPNCGGAFAATVLAGGYKPQSETEFRLVSMAARDRFARTKPGPWVTRCRPKSDRIACAWPIRRLIAPDARFLCVSPPEAAAAARETGAVRFDVEGVELSHEGERRSFDVIL